MEKQPVSNFKRNIQRTKFILLLSALCIWPNTVWSQKYFSGRKELGVAFGVSNYYGDLSQGQNVKHFHPSVSVYQRYNLSDHFSWRNQFSYLKISGTTEGNSNYEVQNLNFQSEIYEFASMLSFNFHRFGCNINNKKQTPYALFGISGYRHDPYRIEGEISLRAANTELRKPQYRTLQMAFPMGLGYKYMLSQKRNRGALILGVEVVWRKTFTDHLDDVEGQYADYRTAKDQLGEAAAQYGQAQMMNGVSEFPEGTYRGDAHLDDWFYFVGFNISYRFTPLICR